MLSDQTLKLVEDNVKQILDPLGFELIELKSINSKGGLILRFLIDRDEGGITISECAQLNRDISQMLDEKNTVGQEYNLEVSSPGLDRPLINPRDFKRVIEKIIHVFLKEQQSGKWEFEGKLIKLDEAGIFVTSNKGEELFIPFTKINRAKQVIK